MKTQSFKSQFVAANNTLSKLAESFIRKIESGDGVRMEFNLTSSPNDLAFADIRIICDEGTSEELELRIGIHCNNHVNTHYTQFNNSFISCHFNMFNGMSYSQEKYLWNLMLMYMQNTITPDKEAEAYYASYLANGELYSLSRFGDAVEESECRLYNNSEKMKLVVYDKLSEVKLNINN